MTVCLYPTRDLRPKPCWSVRCHAANLCNVLQALVRSSPELASQPEFQALSNLRGVDVVATRLFFDRRVDLPRAASVAGGGLAPGEESLESPVETFLRLTSSPALVIGMKVRGQWQGPNFFSIGLSVI